MSFLFNTQKKINDPTFSQGNIETTAICIIKIISYIHMGIKK